MTSLIVIPLCATDLANVTAIRLAARAAQNVQYTTAETCRSAGSTAVSPSALRRAFGRRFTDHTTPTCRGASSPGTGAALSRGLGSPSVPKGFEHRDALEKTVRGAGSDASCRR